MGTVILILVLVVAAGRYFLEPSLESRIKQVERECARDGRIW